MNNESKQIKDDAKIAKHIQKYSTDYDATIVIKIVFGMFGGFVLGLVVLEVLTRIFIYPEATDAIYLTPELIHSIMSYLAGFASGIITALFGKKIGEKIAETANGKTNKELNK